MLPVINGVGPGRVLLPRGSWPRLIDFLIERFPDVSESSWRSRFGRGLVLDAAGQTLDDDAPFTPEKAIHYYRELDDEPSIPYEAAILHQDEHLLIADKPHFLPVIPAGRWLHQTLLVRLKKVTGLDDLVPLHRIDRGTAGVIAFSVNPQTRGRYQSMFPQRVVTKVYEALAPALPVLDFPRTHQSRMVAGEPFFRMQEVPGEPNSETRIEIIEPLGSLARYRLWPVTGRKHQLRVHMAALGAPILNDPFYPDVLTTEGPHVPDDFTRPLKLLARGLGFDDPLTGQPRWFESRRSL